MSVQCTTSLVLSVNFKLFGRLKFEFEIHNNRKQVYVKIYLTIITHKPSNVTIINFIIFLVNTTPKLQSTCMADIYITEIPLTLLDMIMHKLQLKIYYYSTGLKYKQVEEQFFNKMNAIVENFPCTLFIVQKIMN